ncbi:MAG: pyruvate synthase subunit PorB [Thermodesulfobacteriota bacterium]|jgi:pyruvate ferredoxin oxidoreductase beta subunit
MISEDLKDFKRFTPKTLPKEEPLVFGHRACQGCGEVLALRMVAKAIGSPMIAVSATGCMEIISSPYPQTAWAVPWIHVAFENAAAVASGVEVGLKTLMAKGRIPEKKITVVTFAGDGGTADIGLQSLSGAMERGHDFVYVCLDNEAYMNTGIQRSSETPFGAMTTTSPAGKITAGQTTWKKNLPAIMAAHDIPYVATASPAYYLDLMNKAKKAALIQGPAYLHVFSPCPTGWHHGTDLAVEVSRLVVETNIFPLYEVIEGKYVVRKNTRLKPVEEYLKQQRRFSHLTSELIQTIQKRVDAEYEKLLKMETLTGSAETKREDKEE